MLLYRVTATTQILSSLQRSREEYNENTEFTETERIMLMEANVDLEAQVLLVYPMSSCAIIFPIRLTNLNHLWRKRKSS